MKDIEIHEKFQLYGKNLRHWLNECKILLPKINNRQIYKRYGFETIYEYARVIAGLSRNQVNESLRILTKLENKPALMKLAKRQGINKIKTLATIATEENQEILADSARKMSTRAVEQWARDLKENGHHVMGNTSNNDLQKPIKNLKVFTAKLTKETINKLQKVKSEQTWEQLMKEFLEFREQHFKQTAPPTKREATRHTPKKIKTHIENRSQNICEHPNCNQPAHQIHHAQRFSQHRIHNPNKMWNLCGSHHQLAHHGFLKNENLSPSNWQTTLTSTQAEADELAIKYRHQPRPG